MEPLNWSPYSTVDADRLGTELAALADHLTTWSAGQADPDDAPSVAAILRGAKVQSAERLEQSFMPAVEILRLVLAVEAGAMEGIFLRQQIARGYPALWPLLDSSPNLYSFLQAIPGVLDATRENAFDYGLFFANEAIVGPDGPFRFYRDFNSLPEASRQGVRDQLAKRKEAANAAGEAAGDSGIEARVLAYLEGDARGMGAGGFESLEYNRDEDKYGFFVFGEYANEVWAARIKVGRASGVPTMEDDFWLGSAAPGGRVRGRLTPARIARALGSVEWPVTPVPSPAAPPRSISPAEALEAIAGTGRLEDAHVTGELAIGSATRIASLVVRNCVVDGSLLFEGLRVDGDLALENVRLVDGKLQLKGARVTGSMRLADLAIQSADSRGIILAEATVGGALDLERCNVLGLIDLTDLQVGLRLHLAEVRAGGLFAPRLSVLQGPILVGSSDATRVHAFGLISSGDVELIGARSAGDVVLLDSHVGGGLRLRYVRAAGSIEIGGQEEVRTFIRDNLDLGGVCVGGDILVHGVHIGNHLTMAGGAVSGQIRLGAGIRGLAHRGHDCTIGRDVALTSSEVKGPVQLGGIQIQGTLRLELCTLGAMLTSGQIVWDYDPARLATLVPAVIRNGVEILACQIRGELRFSRALVDERYAGRFAFEVTNSTVGQDISFWEEGLAEPKTTEPLIQNLDFITWTKARESTVPEGQDPLARRRWVFGQFDATTRPAGWPVLFLDAGAASEPSGERALIAEDGAGPSGDISIGELRSSLSARAVYTEIRGDVRMALCNVDGDLCLTNLRAAGKTIVLESLVVKGDLLAEWKGRRYNAPAEPWAQPYVGLLRTTAARLDMAGSTVVGEARLTGLELSGRARADHAGPGGDRVAALSARYSKIEGVLALSDGGGNRSARADPRSRASIKGDLDVSWSTVDHLILDGQSLGATTRRMRSGDPPAATNRLVATNAMVRKLELRDPLPGEVDLADAQVTVWDFGAVEGDELLGRFRNVLGNQQPFKRNVYQEVEGYLYNAGFEDLSKTIHMDLVRRQHRDTTERLEGAERGLGSARARIAVRLKRAVSELNRLATGNFTSEWRPIVWCWIPLWLMSSCYFADPARIDVAEMFERNFTDQPEAVCATLDHWGVWESLKFTTRYVLPVIPSVGMDELDAGDDLQTHPRCLGAAERIRSARSTPWSALRHGLDRLGVRPSTVATWARLLAWLLLSLATGTIFAKMSRTPRSSA